MTKRIGYILRKFPCLSETFILNEILELESKGIEVHIFSLKRPNDPKFHQNLVKLKAKIIYVPEFSQIKTLWKHKKKALKNFGKTYRLNLFQVAKELNPKLFFRFLQSLYVANRAKNLKLSHLHAHFATKATTVANFSAKMLNIPHSFTAHAFDIFKQDASRKVLKRKIHQANFIVTVSDYNKRFLENVANEKPEKIIKINNGIDLSLFQPAIVKKEKIFTFLTVARFVEKKGHAVLIEACRHLKDNGLNFRLWLVGQGKLQKEIEKQIRKNKLQDQIKILGPHSQQEVIDRYHLSHAFVLPCVQGKDGNKDGLPVSIVEALACALPVITTPMTGNPEVISNNYNGVMVPFNDALALKKAMESLIVDKQFFEKLQKNTRSSIENNFDIRKTTKDLTTLFMEN